MQRNFGVNGEEGRDMRRRLSEREEYEAAQREKLDNAPSKSAQMKAEYQVQVLERANTFRPEDLRNALVEAIALNLEYEELNTNAKEDLAEIHIQMEEVKEDILAELHGEVDPKYIRNLERSGVGKSFASALAPLVRLLIQQRWSAAR